MKRLPDKCPHCGSEPHIRRSDVCIYLCGTGVDLQSDKDDSRPVIQCYQTELALLNQKFLDERDRANNLYNTTWDLRDTISSQAGEISRLKEELRYLGELRKKMHAVRDAGDVLARKVGVQTIGDTIAVDDWESAKKLDVY